MNEVQLSMRWVEQFPEAAIGLLLVSGVDNTQDLPLLQEEKQALESQLRRQYAELDRNELLKNPVLAAYRGYYKQFDQTYHVQGQLESIVHKGKHFPQVSPLVDLSFMAELETLVLTASHDADRLVWPLTIDVSTANEPFTQMNGKERRLRGGDMKMVDAQGTVCTILYGQDQRTPVSSTTQRVLYVVYAPKGVPRASVQAQLDSLEAYILKNAPHAVVGMKVILDRMSRGSHNERTANTSG